MSIQQGFIKLIKSDNKDIQYYKMLLNFLKNPLKSITVSTKILSSKDFNIDNKKCVLERQISMLEYFVTCYFFKKKKVFPTLTF